MQGLRTGTVRLLRSVRSAKLRLEKYHAGTTSRPACNAMRKDENNANNESGGKHLFPDSQKSPRHLGDRP